MTCIFRIIQRYWSTLFPQGSIQRVTFTPSTIALDRERILRNIASPTPFQNFLNEIRLTSLHDMGRERMTLRESLKMRKSALKLWPGLSEKKKNKYRDIAFNWEATRLPMQCISKSRTNLSVRQSNNLASDVQPLTDETVGKRKPTKRSRSQPGKRQTRSRTITKRRSKRKHPETIAPTKISRLPRKKRGMDAVEHCSSELCAKTAEHIAPLERPRPPKRKRRLNALERRSSEIYANLGTCVSRIVQLQSDNAEELEEQQQPQPPEMPEEPEEMLPDLSTHRLTKRKRHDNL